LQTLPPTVSEVSSDAAENLATDEQDPYSLDIAALLSKIHTATRQIFEKRKDGLQEGGEEFTDSVLATSLADSERAAEVISGVLSATVSFVAKLFTGIVPMDVGVNAAIQALAKLVSFDVKPQDIDTEDVNSANSVVTLMEDILDEKERSAIAELDQKTNDVQRAWPVESSGAKRAFVELLNYYGLLLKERGRAKDALRGAAFSAILLTVAPDADPTKKDPGTLLLEVKLGSGAEHDSKERLSLISAEVSGYSNMFQKKSTTRLSDLNIPWHIYIQSHRSTAVFYPNEGSVRLIEFPEAIRLWAEACTGGARVSGESAGHMLVGYLQYMTVSGSWS